MIEISAEPLVNKRPLAEYGKAFVFQQYKQNWVNKNATLIPFCLRNSFHVWGGQSGKLGGFTSILIKEKTLL